MKRAAWIAVVACTLALTGRARASDPDVEAGVAAYEEGDLDGALERFRAAANGDGMTREDVVRMLTYRALVEFAARDEGAVETTVLALATLGGDDPFGDRAPPPVREAFDRARAEMDGELHVTATAIVVPGGIRVEGRVVGDPGALTVRVRTAARSPGAALVDAADGPVTVPGATPENVEVAIEAIGPGGAILARLGLRDAPVPIPAAVEATEDTVGSGALAGARAEDDDGGLGAGAWVGIIMGALAAAAVVVVVVLLVTTPGAQAEHMIAQPVVDFP